SEADKRRQSGGTAITQKRQRDPGDRHETDDHANVFQNMEKQNPHNPHNDKHPEVVSRCLGVVYGPHDDENQHAKSDDHSEKPQLFTDNRENEVRMSSREKAQLILATLEQTLAPEAPGTDCDLRLHDLVSLAQRVHFRVHECKNAILL